MSRADDKQQLRAKAKQLRALARQVDAAAGGRYDSHRQKMAEASRERSASGRDIGPLPPTTDPARKGAGGRSLLRFCLNYFPARFPLAFSSDHLAFVGDLERVVLEGGQLAVAMPRGSGKTTLAEVAAVWAAVYGHRRFVMLIGATEAKAVELLESIKAEIETNDLLAADFPEVCHPIRMLEGINNRAGGQTLGGERTRIEWTDRQVMLPRVAGAASGGTIIRVAGITGAVRGASVTVDGRKVRPDLVILDDPQTDDSARSPSQVTTRETVLNGAVLGLAGPGQRIAVVMPCTVIRPGDLADRALDRERSPQWAGRRCKMLAGEPTDVELWGEYAEILRKGLRADPPTREPATDFYRRHRAELDAGAVAAWPERFNPDEVSAIQHAMNLKIADARAFYAEYQNEPQADESDDSRGRPIVLTEIPLSRCPRGEVPPTVTRITAGVDVQQEVLFWFVVGWDESYGGQVLDYGAWPDQMAARFSGTDPYRTLTQRFPGKPLEARLFAGLEELAGHVLGRDWLPQGGGLPMRVGKCLVDAGWGEQTDTVHAWARQSAFANIVTPSKGVGIGAKKTPFSQWAKRDGERAGAGWRLTGQGRGRLCLIDTNWMKSFVAERLRTPAGAKGGLTLFGSDYSGHALLGDHLASETPVTVTAGNRRVDEWQLNPGRPDNHWLDCAIMATAAAGVLGLRYDPAAAAGVATANRQAAAVKMSERQKARRTLNAR